MSDRRAGPSRSRTRCRRASGPPAATVEPGLERMDEFVVEDRLVTDVGGTIGVRVLSTPGMIAMMERNSAVLSYENLPEGKATVGFEVCVKHVSAAAEGARCQVRSTLREVVDGRKLRFEVEVREGERTIGVGTHERRVIDVGRLATGSQRSLALVFGA